MLLSPYAIWDHGRGDASGGPALARRSSPSQATWLIGPRIQGQVSALLETEIGTDL